MPTASSAPEKAPPPRRRRRVPTIALVVAASAIWGSNFVAMKHALASTTPLVLGMLRAAIGGTALVCVGLALGASLPRDRAQLRAIFWVALNMTTVSTGLLVVGVSWVPAGLASLLSSTMPLFMVLLAGPALGERASRRAVAGTVIGFGGTALIAVPAVRGDTSPLGVVFMILAALTWASGSVIYKRHDLSAVHPMMLVGVQLWMSAIGLGVVAIPLEGLGSTRMTWDFAVALAWLSLVGLALVFSLWAEILRRGSAVQASATGYLSPLFGVVFGAVVLGEQLTPLELTGGALVVAGVAATTNSTDHVAGETRGRARVAPARGPADLRRDPAVIYGCRGPTPRRVDRAREPRGGGRANDAGP